MVTTSLLFTTERNCAQQLVFGLNYIEADVSIQLNNKKKTHCSVAEHP